MYIVYITEATAAAAAAAEATAEVIICYFIAPSNHPCRFQVAGSNQQSLLLVVPFAS